MQNHIQAANKKAAESLRRLADLLEQSDLVHHWHLRATASEPVSVSMASIDDPAGVKYGPVKAVFVVGDEAFVSRLKTHIEHEA